MRLICCYSAIQFSCDHFPGTYSSSETFHPIFQLPQKKLLASLGKWAAGQLSPIDNYLLYIALLKSTDLITFRVPCNVSHATEALIANNMEKLAKIVSRISSIPNPASHFPNFIISPDTRTLSTTPYWIELWENAYKEFQSGYKSTSDSRLGIIERELALERLIRNPHSHPSSYSNKLAEWAVIAGSFPEWNTTSPFNSQVLSCADYWKLLIHKCAAEDTLYQVPKIDLEDLLAHCEDNIPIGTLFSHTLFKILRAALEKQKNFLELGDGDIRKTSYQILNSTDSVEDANIRAMMQSAPESEPKPNQYPNKLAFIRAKMRWDMSKKYGTQES